MELKAAQGREAGLRRELGGAPRRPLPSRRRAGAPSAWSAAAACVAACMAASFQLCAQARLAALGGLEVCVLALCARPRQRPSARRRRLCLPVGRRRRAGARRRTRAACRHVC